MAKHQMIQCQLVDISPSMGLLTQFIDVCSLNNHKISNAEMKIICVWCKHEL